MRRFQLVLWCLLLSLDGSSASGREVWPDGSAVDAWYGDTARVELSGLGRQWLLTDHGVTATNSSLIQTGQIQGVIDSCASSGGGVVVVPAGTYLTGALFLRRGVHLWLSAGGTLKGVDDIAHYPVVETRLEGRTLRYLSALINADGCDGLTIGGEGCVDGNGERFWREFWIRREVDPGCTNLEALRPRLLYISRSADVTLSGVCLRNSGFWTTHIYRCRRFRALGTATTSPRDPLRAPSTDAFDIDACSDVHIVGCYMSVNDDAVVLKGGKGTWADRDSTNGPNERVLVERCRYGFCHGCLTLGSESLLDRNVVLRDCLVEGAARVLWLKMRPDTPQRYEHVLVEGVRGRCGSFVVVRPWEQFNAPGVREMPRSECRWVTLRDVDVDCERFWEVLPSGDYLLRDFRVEGVRARSVEAGFAHGFVEGMAVIGSELNGEKLR